MKIKIGNSVDLLFSIKDSSGVAVQNLSEATAIKFMVKVNQTDTDLEAKISKTLIDGITIDTPAVGNIKVILTALNTMLTPGKYYVALQIEWATYIQEVNIKESGDELTEINTITFAQDIIR